MDITWLIDLEIGDIKQQGAALKNVHRGDIGKRPSEIVGEAYSMNYKKVMLYIRLSYLVPDIQDMVDGTAADANGEPIKKLGFIPAVKPAYPGSPPHSTDGRVERPPQSAEPPARPKNIRNIFLDIEKNWCYTAYNN